MSVRQPRRRAQGVEISDEQARILRSAREDRLFRNEHQRWLVAGAARPDRRERERLFKRGMLDYYGPPFDFDRARITARGRAALAVYEGMQR